MNHVKGKLAFAHRQNKLGYATEIFDETNQVVATAAWYPVAIGHDGIGTNREENARRLVACWNAFLPFKTEQIETGIDLAALVKERDDLRKVAEEKDRMLEAIKEVEVLIKNNLPVDKTTPAWLMIKKILCKEAATKTPAE